MISPWQIYLVMQLDSIRDLFGGIAISLIFGSVVIGAFVLMHASDDEYSWNIDRKDDRKNKRAGFVRAIRIAFPFAAVCLFAQAVIPSSKTAAAMIVIPAIANSEVLQKEAGDLYQLAKQGLRELVNDDAKEGDAK